jgi:hypothetical protein
MVKRLASAAVLLLLTLALGAGSAGGRASAISNITVQVIGVGTVTSSPAGFSCGGGSTTCSLAFSGSGTTTLTATPASGWSFDGWSSSLAGCSGATCVVPSGTDADATANFSGPPTTTSTLSVTTSGTGEVSDGAIDCGALAGSPSCSQAALTGSTLTLVESPDTDQVFTGWGGACTGTGRACTVQLNGDRAVSATWVSSTGVLLSVSLSGAGAVTGGGIDCPSSCTATEATNSTVVLIANPDPGQIFSGWSGDCTGTGLGCVVTMDEAKSVTATFAPVFQLSVSVNGNGNVSGEGGAINCGNSATVCSASFALNKSVTLTATPVGGATFSGWSGACGGVSTSCTILMSAAESVTATFVGGTGASVPLTVSVSGLGKVTGGAINCGNGASACSTSVASGTTITLTETPAGGATFSGWGGACSGTTSICTVSMTVARSVSASFSGGSATVPLTVSVSGRGKVAGGGINCGNGASACSTSVASGTTITLTETPAGGATFSGWGGACSGTTSRCTLTPSAATSVTAMFSGGASTAAGTLTITVSGAGSVSTSAGKCSAGASKKKTCVQRFTANKTVQLKAAAAAGSRFGGWSGACSGTKKTCSVSLSTGRQVTASFKPTGSPLARLGSPLVRRSGSGYRVTLRFTTTLSGAARMVALRAGRRAVTLPLRVAAGRVAIGPFAVAKAGLYTFQVRIAGHSLSWRACLGACFARAPGPDFVLTGGQPQSTRSGDAWSVTLRMHANLISEGNVRVLRGTKVLVRKRVLGSAGDFQVGPFLFGPGSYTVRFSATDPFGRVRSLSWLVALAP